MSKKYLIILIIFGLLQSCNSSESTEEVSDTDKLFTLLSPDDTHLKFKNQLKEDKENNHLVNDQFVTGAGVAVGDINNDGLADIFFTGNQVEDRLFLNKGGMRFEDITEKAGIAPDKTWSTGATFADVNGDGYVDLYICKNVNQDSEKSINKLYINKGDLTFEEEAEAYGLADKGFSVQATFFDFDMDGYLDMYLVNQPPSLGNRRGGKIDPYDHVSLLYSDKIYKNVDNKGFADATEYAGVFNFAYGLSASVGDFNNDGYPDIYVANDFDLPDHLYINRGDGTYENRINQAVKHISNFSMGTDVADYDNDGLMDVMVLDMVAEDHKRIKTFMGGMNPDNFWKVVKKGWHYQYMFNTLQRNNGNGTFGELAHLGGVSNTDWSWGPLFADFDNDGWKDLFVTNGVKRNMRHGDLDKTYTTVLDSLELIAKRKGEKLQDMIDIMEFVEMAPVDKLPNYIFKNNGDLTFSKKIEEWGMELPSLSNGAAYADFDNDGDIDIVVSNIDEYAFLYQNNAIQKGKGNYLRFDVRSKYGSPAYGTSVKLMRHGDLWQLQHLSNARGFFSKSEDQLHFGLGEETMIEKAIVTWPNGKEIVLENINANQLVKVHEKDAQNIQLAQSAISKGKAFTDVSRNVGLTFQHKENKYDDYENEPLLPHKMSNFGPGLATGDVNGDGLDDFFIGGAAGYTGAIFKQKSNGQFEKIETPFLEEDKAAEDLGGAFFDADQDGDLDLYVVSGGNEFKPNDPLLQDRLYINHGAGKFRKENDRLPQMLTSGSRVVPGDFDQDGDQDLFVAGRLIPGSYPLPARSYILQNNNGRFDDVTEGIAPELLKAGLVTSAAWTDYNNDDQLDLVLVGEWMPVTFFENQDGKFKNVTNELGLENTAGWYYEVVAKDFDHDGDDDYVVGNLGLNYKYKASLEQPFEVYSHDFDANGTLDIVLSYYEHGEMVPVRGRSCSSQQIPGIKEEFPTFESFGDANLTEIYGNGLDEALRYQAHTFASAYIENVGNGSFKITPLPNVVQVSSINNIVAHDFNGDKNLDLLVSGNLYSSEIETPRNDAGMGMYLEGDGKGNFKPIPLHESGFFAPHDAKDMQMIHLGREKTPLILVANNRYWMQAIKHDPQVNELQENLLSKK
ncbi:VCBS repeat-containing protein [Fulvivirgaceae bacterium BMA10]|uniref:VCBS repeat-containing protein n=1 Tax=Splendidivirga corallicola TaxID=3051826 RepID=A0ABT8KUJ9_9BACT|nr:VCBS repeat-containing protein [Fulvivirgaceae bacterium BMA10]